MVQTLHRRLVPVNTGFNNAVDRLQKVRTVRLNVESDEVRTEKPVYKFALPRADAECLRIRPGNMPENSDAGVGTTQLDHAWQKREVVVLQQDHRPADIFHFFEQCVSEFPVDVLIVLPIAGTEQWTRVRDVAERPQTFVGESVVITLFFFFREPNAP